MKKAWIESNWIGIGDPASELWPQGYIKLGILSIKTFEGYCWGVGWGYSSIFFELGRIQIALDWWKA